MRVALFGGTGFAGNYLVEALLEAGHTPSVLVRPGSEDKLRAREQCEVTTGDISSIEAIDATIAGCQAVIYNIGILRETPRRGITFEALHVDGTRRVVDAAQRNGVRRMLMMSANGVKDPGTPYQETKYRADKSVMNSELDWTVFRPSLIFGNSHGMQEITHQLYRELVRPPVPAAAFPGVIMSPVWVRDVADAFVNALSNTETIGRIYELGGPDELSWQEMIRRVAKAAGKNKLLVPVPLGLMKIAATLFDWLPFFPATRDQLTMLGEGNVAPPDELERLIGRAARPFTPESLSYLR